MALFRQDALNDDVRELQVLGWAKCDFADSGCTTVVLTAVFGACFVGGVADNAPWETMAWTGALASQFVPVTMLITAGVYALASIATFALLRERAVPPAALAQQQGMVASFSRLLHTWREARRFDVFAWLLACAVAYQAGTSVVIALAAVYGLWTFATRLSAIVGPLTYGVVTLLTASNHRIAIMHTGVFFVIGLVLLMRVNVQRGMAAADAVPAAAAA